MDLVQFLQYLAFGGGSVAAFSFLAERWAWFKALTSDQKNLVAFGGSSVIGVSAFEFLQYAPASMVSALNPVFAIISVCFGTYFVVSVFHFYTKSPSDSAPVAPKG